MVNITLKSTPGSTAAICIIDQSVELMGNLNELTSKKIVSQLTEAVLTPYNPPIPQDDESNQMRFWWPGKTWKKTPALEILNVCLLNRTKFCLLNFDLENFCF